jgi:TrmH family RNA methyltransferase
MVFSVSSGLLSTVRDLARRRARRRRNLTLAEGVRLAEDIVNVGASVRGVVTAPMLQASDRGTALKARLGQVDAPQVEVSDTDLIQLADTDHPQGVILVVEPPAWELGDIHVAPRSPVLVVDGVQDPGNVGALCRTAHGLGAAGVLALPGTAELFAPKALRGSMGAVFHLPALRCDDDVLIKWLEQQGIELWLSDIHGTPVPDADTHSGRVALVVGNEGAGARQAMKEHASHLVGVPLIATAESLNVAVAAGILLYEVVHGR